MSAADVMLTAMGLGVHSMEDPVRGWHRHVTDAHAPFTSDAIMVSYLHSPIPHDYSPVPQAPPLGPIPGPPDDPDVPDDSDKPDVGFDADLAYMAKAAYHRNDMSQEVYQLGYTVDEDLSDSNVSDTDHIYTTFTKNGKAVVAYRGTNPFNTSDLHADLAISNGTYSWHGRFTGAEMAYVNAVNKYGKDNVQVTGHSLGGSQALHMGRKFGAHGAVFAPGMGAGSWSLHKSPITIVVMDPLYGYKSPTGAGFFAIDPVSLLAHQSFVPEDQVWVTPKHRYGIQNHGMDNYLPAKDARLHRPSMPPVAADQVDESAD